MKRQSEGGEKEKRGEKGKRRKRKSELGSTRRPPLLKKKNHHLLLTGSADINDIRTPTPRSIDPEVTTLGGEGRKGKKCELGFSNLFSDHISLPSIKLYSLITKVQTRGKGGKKKKKKKPASYIIDRLTISPWLSKQFTSCCKGLRNERKKKKKETIIPHIDSLFWSVAV